jgi:hypothetical protein
MGQEGIELSPEAQALLESVKSQGEMIANMKKQGIVEKAKVGSALCLLPAH